MTDKARVSESNKDTSRECSSDPIPEPSLVALDESVGSSPPTKLTFLQKAVRTRRGRAILSVLAIWLPVAVIMLAGYYWVKVPLDKNLIASETLRLVGDINSLVKARSSIMAVSVDYLRKDGEITRESLDVIFEGLQSQFPDFRSLELINDNGEITAMVGELPISGAGLTSRTQVGRFRSLGSTDNEDAEVLQDDPEAGLFFLTRSYDSGESRNQFVRAKFARGPLELTLAAAEKGSVKAARLIPVSGGGAEDWRVAAGSGGSAEARVVGDFWHGPIRGEALLNTKGWAVTLARVGSPAVLAYVLMVLGAFGAVLIFLALRFSRPNSESVHYADAGFEPMTRFHPTPAVPAGKTPFNVDPGPIRGDLGSQAETLPTKFWGEDYSEGDLFCTSGHSHGEASDDFFATGSTSEFVEQSVENLYRLADRASQESEPLDIAWYEPFGSEDDKASETDTGDDESGESFDRA